MKTRIFVTGFVLALTVNVVLAQVNGGFDLDAYMRFLAGHQNLESAQLRSMYPAGTFLQNVPVPASQPKYLDSIDYRYSLTSYEKGLIDKHGFAVTSRLSRHTMIEAFGEIYDYDLPVFISTDAILEAVHLSYDNILKEIEKTILLPELDALLTSLRAHIPRLEQRYSSDARMIQMLRDVDVYLTVPLNLLGKPVPPYFVDNGPLVRDLLSMIVAQQPRDVALFARTPRSVDFSQFTVRGHYTQDTLLAKYFQAMIWLGRTEIYLLAPEGTTTPWPKEDIQRQAIDAILVAEAVEGANAQPALERMDTVITFLVGESDNVTVRNLGSLMQEAAVQSASELLDTIRLQAFQDLLLRRPFAFQRINSQILMTDPCDPQQVRPPSAFMLLGQRFVIDSYITGNVVYDKIVYNGRKIARMLPSTLDVLFSLGNNAAAQLLEPELLKYRYSTNLAALRFLVDSYEDEFWKSSLFNSWLWMLRMLNPPQEKSHMPAFMRTAAWWQEKMNTQLASWAQLRHDNLLYAKQSYTPGIICSYPESYVEPIPEFFNKAKSYAVIAASRFGSMGLSRIESYFQDMIGTMDTLGSIAQKELAGTPLLPEEKGFLRGMLFYDAMCGEPYTGWYPRLYYGISFTHHDTERLTDFLVADVHTAPTDEHGTIVGWVVHVGTGPVDLAILASETPEGKYCAFIGPVFTYYERIASDFKRLTDEEWKTLYNMAPTLRPAFVNIYLADENGQSRGEGPTLLTAVLAEPGDQKPGSFVLYQNFPNPFNPSTFIAFTVPASSAEQRVRLEICDVQGQVVAKLLDERLPSGNYVVRWDGITVARKLAASGVYFYYLSSGNFTQRKKLVLLK